MRTSAILLAAGLFLSPAALRAGPLDEISHRDKLYDLATRGEEVFAVGYPGLLLHSPDRGATWETIDVGTDDVLFAIDINAAGQAAIVGRSGLVLTSADGGKSWKRQKTGVDANLFDVAVSDTGNVWAVGHFGAIVHSADAGATWEPQSYDATLPPLPEGEEGSAARCALSTAEEENEGAAEEARLNAVRFADDKHGWIAGEFGIILHTDDGGATWRRQRGSTGKLLFALHVFDTQRVVAVGCEGTATQTLDGGQRWTDVEIGTGDHVLGLWPQGDDLYLVGREGMILVRRGTMGKFERVDVGLYSWLNAVRFIDDGLGFAAGGRGYLLQTTDGGKSWTRLSGR